MADNIIQILIRAKDEASGESSRAGSVYNVPVPAIDSDIFRSYMRTGKGARELPYLSNPAMG